MKLYWMVQLLPLIPSCDKQPAARAPPPRGSSGQTEAYRSGTVPYVCRRKGKKEIYLSHHTINDGGKSAGSMMEKGKL